MKESYSPMMQQYLKVKEENKDAIVMYRLGDFYEMFFEDALYVSKALSLTLTGKNAGTVERVPMCGVPFHSAASYIQQLIDLGKKVCIVEQVGEVPKRGLVKREVVQIVTPGTIFNLNDNQRNNYIAAIKEFDFNYVLAFCDITTGDFQAITIEKNNMVLLNQLAAMNVSEVVVNQQLDVDFGDQIMVSQGKEETYSEAYQKMFIAIKDLRQIKTCSLLLNYLLETQKRELDYLQVIQEINVDDYLVMDTYTKKSLELIDNFNDGGKQGSLFWLLDQTKTAMGSRMLKHWIERPLIKADLINERLDYVELISKSFIQRETIKQILQEIYDLERLASRIAFGNINARDLVWISTSLKVVPELKQQLLSFNHSLTDQLASYLVDLSQITDLIDAAIIDEPPLTVKEGGIIKDGYSPDLDELRYIAGNGKQWLLDFEQTERERTGIKGLKVGYNRVFGYYIEVTKGQLSQVKEEFGYTRKQSLSTAERFITEELKDMEAKLLSAQDKAVKLEYQLFNEVRLILRQDVHRIQEVAKTIALVDCYISLGGLATGNNYVRPRFSQYQEMKIIGGRHGVIEKVMGAGKYVANDLIISQEQPILLITGPNMGGKSTYMRQNALICLMAQIGSFVPAKEAILPIFDQIFTRIGASDDLIRGQSTFMLEMLEANNALTYATNNSLIIFGEIGRGTATYDGMAIAQAMVEYIGTKIGAITLFSTHYHELTYLEEKNIGVKNVHAKASVNEGKLIFHYQIVPGKSEKSYGVNVAKLAGLPDYVLSRANQLLLSLEQNDNRHNLDQEVVVKEIVKESPGLSYLKRIDPMQLSPMQALETLIELRKMIEKEE